MAERVNEVGEEGNGADGCHIFKLTLNYYVIPRKDRVCTCHEFRLRGMSRQRTKRPAVQLVQAPTFCGGLSTNVSVSHRKNGSPSSYECAAGTREREGERERD